MTANGDLATNHNGDAKANMKGSVGEVNGRPRLEPTFENGANSPVTTPPEIDGNEADPIAICGFSIKFPQDATSPENFWKMLVEKRCAMSKFPLSRLNEKGFSHKENRLNTFQLQGGHFIEDDLSAFDADFFSISPAEAAAMDPMQRFLLETAYRALENAGIPMERASGSSTGVYTGSFSMDYMIQLYRDAEDPPMHAALGLGLSMLANRLSWFFNFRGPSIGLDTACSSTATAVDLACQSLRNGSSDMGMVAGCNLTFSPEYFKWMTNLNFLSPDSRCYSFDHRANGYARGEGIGVIILKRLSDAIRDGNTIRAVIRSTGSNEDGRTLGITQPSSEAQEHLIRETYRRAGLSMAYTRYFEAHGTGTPLGDPLETRAIGAAFNGYRTNADPIYVGAVKSNIGHLEGASGIAGIVKAVLALEKAVIPPNTNFEKLNPKIESQSLPLKFPQECHPWPTTGLRRASINSFGYGGANSHIVLDDAYNYLRLRNLTGKHCTQPFPPRTSMTCNSVNGLPKTNGTTSHYPRLLVWSATDKGGLDRLSKLYQDYACSKALQKPENRYVLEDLAYTLDSRRSRFPWRSFAVVETLADLQSLQSPVSHPTQARSSPPRVGYVFSGQGAQWPAMGKELMSLDSYSRDISQADSYLKTLGCRWSVTEELLKPKEISSINNTEFSQTLCTVLQVALVNLLRRFGLRPEAVVGHSSGEIAAAYAAGYISCESAWKLAYFRGVCSAELSDCPKQQPRGAMLAVGLSEDAVKDELAAIGQVTTAFGISIACVNSPNSVTISGEDYLIDQLKDRLDEKKIFARKLAVTVAYHSGQMSRISARYASMIGSLSKGEEFDQVPMISSVTEERVSADRLVEASYWVSNMELPVRFSQAVLSMCAEIAPKTFKQSSLPSAPIDYLVEIGPHAALQGPVREILLASPRGKNVGYSSVLRRGKSALVTALTAIGELFSVGVELDLRTANEPSGEGVDRSLLVDLPEYPFDHSQKYWHESRLSRNYRLREHAPSEFLGVRSRDWNLTHPRWRHFIKTAESPWVEDHVINGTVLYPAGGMVAMAVEAAKQLVGNPSSIVGYTLRDVSFENPMDLTANAGSLEVQTSLRDMHTTDQNNKLYEFIIQTYTKDGNPIINCRGFISTETSDTEESWTITKERNQRQALLESFPALQSSSGKSVDFNQMYDFLKEHCGYEYGPCFRVAQDQRYDDDHKQALAEVALFRSATDAHVIHPISMDALFHLPCTALTSGGTGAIATSIPTRVGYLWISNNSMSWPEQDTAKCCTMITNTTRRGFTSNGIAMSSSAPNDVCLYYDGLELTSVTDAPKSNVLIPSPKQFPLHLDCKVALNKLKPEEVCMILDGLYPDTQDWTEFFHDLELLVQVSVSKFLDSVDLAAVDKKDPWRPHFWNWADYNLKESRRKCDWGTPDPQAYGELTERVSNYNSIGKLYTAVAANLIGLWQGDVNPLELLVHSGLLRDCYKDWNNHSTAMQISSYVDLLAHQTPGMKILEVGGGTGSGTRNIVSALCTRRGDPEGFLRCSRYDFTDVSAAFLDRAREEFEHYHSQMTFGVLDIDRDFAEQGFGAGSYDVLLAVSVLHISSDLVGVVKRIRKALKPGGKLIMQESFTPSGWTLGYIFGLFPGWWFGVEDGRVLSPSISIDDWDKLLKENGFSGVDIVRDLGREGAFHYGWIISTATEDESPPVVSPAPNGPKITIVVDENCPQQHILADAMLLPLNELGVELAVSSIEAFTSTQETNTSKFNIFLADYGCSYLKLVNEKGWEQLKTLVRRSRSLLWVSSDGGQNGSPDQGMLDGLARTLRVEYYELHLVTLALEYRNSSDLEKSVLHLTDIVQEMLSKTPHSNYEQDYVEIGGRLHTKRLVEANYLQSAVETRIAPHEVIPTRLDSGTEFTTAISPSGRQSTPHFIEAAPLFPPEPEDDYADVAVKAASIMGRKEDQNLGKYYSGIIIKAGPNSNLHPGDRVFAVSSSFRSVLRLPSQAVSKISSPDISLSDACWAVPPIAAAYTALVEVGRVRPGDSILVDAGISLVGLASLQVLQALGVKDVWTTAVDESESAWITSHLRITEERILPKAWFTNPLISAPQWKQKFDIFFSADTAESPVVSMNSVKSGGRYITLRTIPKSSKDIAGQRIHAPPSNISLSIIDLAERSPSQEALSYAVSNMDALMTTVTKERISQFPASSMEDVLSSLRLTNDQKTVVITFDESDTADITVPTRPKYEFDHQGTYIIAGGLGGLGREISRWLVRRGARHLLLLSRNGPRTPEALELLAELEGQGVQVETPCCNVSDQGALKSTLAACAERLPPIKGCIQASMVMTESPFLEMPYSDWKAAVTPKVLGSWNLHEELPKGLDFFVMISSVQGVLGTVLLSGYNAGNTYQDAVARYRVSQGERAVSLDLGGVSDIGFIAENEKYKTIFERNRKLSALLLKEVCALLDVYCDPKTSLSATSCQSVVGINHPENWDSDDDSFTIKQPFWGHLHYMPSSSSNDQEELDDATGSSKRKQTVNPAVKLAAAKSAEEAVEIVVEALVERIHRLLGTDKDRVDLERPMQSYGIDSLSAIDLRNWISKVFDVDMPVFEILGGVTFASGALSIVEKVQART
ncbi:putative polyketide synthase [Hypomontagnella monticulosa]|nr:putative polyketide synthase [Hypomontagnella monticulosa]